MDSRYLRIHHRDANPKAAAGHTALLHVETTVRAIITQLSSLRPAEDRNDSQKGFFFYQQRRSPGTYSSAHGHARSRSYPGHSPSSWAAGGETQYFLPLPEYSAPLAVNEFKPRVRLGEPPQGHQIREAKMISEATWVLLGSDTSRGLRGGCGAGNGGGYKE